jgi:glyoxylase-like metal-dependent hydrolase (beta-lactamase superfamily II)
LPKPPTPLEEIIETLARTTRSENRIMTTPGTLTYDVFVSDQPPQDNGLLPNGERKGDVSEASTLIYGSEDAVLTDPAFTTDQARALGDWVAGKGRNLTDIFITHGHGDHWFAAGVLAERFGARVIATAGSIDQMHAAIAARPLLWDKVYPGIPPSPVTPVTVPGQPLHPRRARSGDRLPKSLVRPTQSPASDQTVG